MKRPAQGSAGAGRHSKQTIAVNACPLPCLYADHHITLTDTTGHVRGTACKLCGQLTSRSEWLAELEAPR